jgi:RNA polymerase sigma factor (sigma-70 family)
MRSDEELMSAYVAGDQAAFDELFERLAPALLRVMRRRLGRPEDAHDLVQLTFLHLHRARRDFKEGKQLRPWLFTIAVNLKREYFRRWKRRPEAPLEAAPESWDGPRGQERADVQQTLGWALQFLSEEQREVIALHWLKGQSFPEIAASLGTTLSAVKVRAHRGYIALRQVLDEESAGLPADRSDETDASEPRITS